MNQVPILMYHWFYTGSAPLSPRSPQLEISPAVFEEQMKYLKNKGFRSISLERLVETCETGKSLDKSIVISFDDGTSDFWEHALPILEKYGFKASLFIVSGFVGKTNEWDQCLGEPSRSLLTWDQLRELHETGYEICSHTHTHPNLTDLDEKQVMYELNQSMDTIKNNLGFKPQFIAYPRGLYGKMHKKAVKNAGYKGACAVILHWRDLLHSDRFELKRITIKGFESMIKFEMRLSLVKSISYKKTAIYF